MVATRATPQPPKDASQEESSRTASQSEDPPRVTSENQSEPAPDDLAAIRAQMAEMAAELQALKEAAASRRPSTSSRSRSSTDSEGHSHNIKITSVSTFTTHYTPQLREEWLMDLRRLFKGSPRKFALESNRILQAVDYMDKACRVRWDQYAREMQVNHGIDVEEIWEYFERWTSTILEGNGTVDSNIMDQLNKAQQRPYQTPTEFAAYLASLEKYFDPKPEKERALILYTKLEPNLKRYLNEHTTVLPETRSEMLVLATKFHLIVNPKGKTKDPLPDRSRGLAKRPRDSSTTEPQGQPSYPRKQGRFGRQSTPNHPRPVSNYTGNQPPLNPNGKNGKPLQCFTCGSTSHLAPACPQKRSTVSSVTQPYNSKQVHFELQAENEYEQE